MVVITQDRTQTIPFNSMCFSAMKSGCIVATPDIIEKPSELNKRVIAVYDNQEKAKAVLEEMCKAYAAGARFIIMKSEAETEKEVPEHDGCKGCKYQGCDLREYPCSQCKQNYLDKWKAKE